MRIAVLGIKPLLPSRLRITLRCNVQRNAAGIWQSKPPGWSAQNTYDFDNDIADSAFRAFAGRFKNWSALSAGALNQLESDLFGLLLTTPAGLAWADLRRDSKTGNDPLRSIFELEDFEAWPWELLRDPRSSIVSDDYVFADTEQPASRLVRSQLGAVAAPWPVRVMVVIGPDVGGKQIGWHLERRALSRLFSQYRHDIEARVLVRPDHQKLVDELKDFKPHVFHFMGHGAGAANGQGHLLIGEQNNMTPWTTKQIAVDFRGIAPVCAVLNACSTAADPTLIEVANAFLAKTSAVIAMGADIAGQSATTFATTFYTELLAGQQIECAVNQGRAALQGMNANAPHWAVPRLFLSHAAIEEAAPFPPFVRRTPALSPISSGLFDDLKYFVDRQTERATLVRQVAQAPAIWLRGDPLLGKSLLAKWFFERMLYHPGEARFLDFSADGRTSLNNFLGVLRRIRDGTSGAGANNPDFQRFNVACNALLSGNVVPVNLPGLFELDLGLKYDPNRSTPGSWRETLGACFLDGLRDWAARGPLTLVVDGFHDCDLTTQRELVPFVFEPLVRSPIANLTLVLSSRDIPELQAINGLNTIPLPYYDGGAASDILGEFIELFIDDNQLAKANQVLQLFLQFRTANAQRWTGALFKDLVLMLKAVQVP
jgi:hypothetical protein